MAIAIQPFESRHREAVRAFNVRLREGGAPPEFAFPERPDPVWLPRVEGSGVFNEFFLALDDGTVRGAYALKRQDFAFQGEPRSTRSIGYYHHPFSEGIVNRTYMTVGVQLLRDALRREPLLYALGMGGYDKPLPKMLVSMGWMHFAVPFFFKVLRPGRFLREVRALRTTPARRFLAGLAAYTGAGGLGIRVAQWAKAVRARKGSRADVDSFASFENAPWAAELWAAAKDQYSFAAVRDPANLNVLYPPGNHRFVRLRVVREGAILGWVIGAERHVPGDPQYGDLRVTTVVDCWARPEHARIVMRSAVEALASSGADLLVSNQSCVWWQQALQASGFFAGPSNFIFAAPTKLIELLQPFEEKRARMHLTRADGDGLYRYCFDESPALNRETLSYSS